MGNKNIVVETLNTDFSLSHIIATSTSTKNYHFHNLNEIFFSLSSDIKCFINGRVYDVKSGDLLLFRPEDIHKMVVNEEIIYERYFILFEPGYISSMSTPKSDLMKCFTNNNDFYPVIHLNKKENHIFIQLMEEAKTNNLTDVFGSDVYKKIYLARILVFINTLFLSSNSDLEIFSDATAYKKISSILKHIDENLAEDIYLDKLSETFYISKYYMEALFKSTIGFSVNEYIIAKRILKARYLLKQNISVSKVAEMVGYNDYCHFIRSFKKAVGISPKQYSKKIEASRS